MKIYVTCREDGKYKQTVEVYWLHFDAATSGFSMSYCWGDMWGIELKCPLDNRPISMEFFGQSATIRFGLKNEAEAFTKWLIEGEQKVQHGFDTMRG